MWMTRKRWSLQPARRLHTSLGTMALLQIGFLKWLTITTMTPTCSRRLHKADMMLLHM
jgi:hypothetical protein